MSKSGFNFPMFAVGFVAFWLLLPHGGRSSRLTELALRYGIPPAAAAVVPIVLFLFLIGWIMKSGMLKSLPERLEFRPAEPKDSPGMSLQELGACTDEIKALGFVWLEDYALATKLASGVQGFGRLFMHPEHMCYCELNHFSNGSVAVFPMCAVIMSSLDGGWSLSTHNRRPMGATYMMRRARSLWTSHPGERPAELLRRHIELRNKMVLDLRTNVKSDLSIQAYFEEEQRSHQERRAVVRRKNIAVALLEMLIAGISPKYEWLGEYRAKESTSKK